MCSQLPVIKGGSFNYRSLEYGSFANLTCDFTYTLKNSEVYTCGQNGTWNGQGVCGK